MAVSGRDPGQVRRIPVKKDILTSLDSPLSEVRLKGTRCQECGEALLGQSEVCQNCGAERMNDIVFSPRGKLWTYTVIGHRPPGDFKGPDPFVPFGLGLVELPEDIRVLSPLTGCDPQDLKIGMEMELVIEKLFVNDEGEEVFSYKFQPVKE